MKPPTFGPDFPEPQTVHEANNRSKALSDQIRLMPHGIQSSELRQHLANKRALLRQWLEKNQKRRDPNARRAIDVLADVSALVDSLELSELTPDEEKLIAEMRSIVADYQQGKAAKAAMEKAAQEDVGDGE